MQKYSHVAALLTDIIRKKREFHWDKKAQEAFKRLKQLFIKEPVLQMFDPQWLMIMKADTSDQVLKSVLSQKDESENLYLVVFYLCKFTESEINYEIHNKELLVIVKVFKQ